MGGAGRVSACQWITLNVQILEERVTPKEGRSSCSGDDHGVHGSSDAHDEVVPPSPPHLEAMGNNLLGGNGLPIPLVTLSEADHDPNAFYALLDSFLICRAPSSTQSSYFFQLSPHGGLLPAYYGAS